MAAMSANTLPVVCFHHVLYELKREVSVVLELK